MWSFKLESRKKIGLNSKSKGKPDEAEVCNVKYFNLIDWCLTFGLFLLFLCCCSFCLFIEEINEKKSISIYLVGRSNIFSNWQERGIFDWCAQKVLPSLLEWSKAEQFLKHFWHFLSLQINNYTETGLSLGPYLQYFSLLSVLGVELGGRGQLGWCWKTAWNSLKFPEFSFTIYFSNPGLMWVWKSTQRSEQPPCPIGCVTYTNSHNDEKIQLVVWFWERFKNDTSGKVEKARL